MAARHAWHALWRYYVMLYAFWLVVLWPWHGSYGRKNYKNKKIIFFVAKCS
jgi:hypothetical protein